MIFFFPVILNDLFESGRDYHWPKPRSCMRCSSSRLWGHGYVTALFDGFNQAFYLKRYRCPDCGCIICLRPKGYLKRFQASIEKIHSSILSKTLAGKWLSELCRNRQRHWYNALLKNIKAYLTDTWSEGVVAGFDFLLNSDRNPVSRTV